MRARHPNPVEAGRGGVRRGNRAAFTLIELLVSMTVLTLLVLMVSQLVDNTVLTTVATGKRIDADSQARLIFERMGSDFAGIAKRPDANYYFHHQTGNDALYFFSDATGYFAGGDTVGTGTTARNSLSLTGYRISDQISNGVRFEMERLGRGLHWYDPNPGASANGPLTAMVYLPLTIAGAFGQVLSDPYNNSSNLNTANGANDPNVPQWDVIGDQVVRLEFCYLLKDGTLSAVPVTQLATVKNNVAATSPPSTSDGAAQGYTSGSRWYDTQAEIGYVYAGATSDGTTTAAVWNPAGLQDIRAVVVAIAVLDGRSRLLVHSSSMTKLIGALPDFNIPAATPPALMGDTWKKVVYGSTFSTDTGLPIAAAGSVRVYQRYFFLN